MALPYTYQVATDARDIIPDPRMYAPGGGVATKDLHTLFFVIRVEVDGDIFYRALPFPEIFAQSGEVLVDAVSNGINPRVLRGWPLAPVTGGKIKDSTNPPTAVTVVRNRAIQSHYKDREADHSFLPTTFQDGRDEHFRQRYQKGCLPMSIEQRNLRTKNRAGTVLDIVAGFLPQPPNILLHFYGYDPVAKYWSERVGPVYFEVDTGVAPIIHQDGPTGTYLDGGVIFFRKDPGRDIPELEFLDMLDALDAIGVTVPDYPQTEWLLQYKYGIYARKGRILRQWFNRTNADIQN